LLYYTGSSILVTLGLNYFYFNFGYSDAGSYQFYFTIVYAAATLLAQFSFQFILNKLKRTLKKLMTISGIVVGVGYLGLFFYVFLDPFAFFPLMAVLGFIVFYFQTFFQLIIYINIQDSIEYNDYKFGERRESAVFSLRALAAKLGNSVQQGVLYLALLIGGLLAISNQISGFEQEAIVQFNGDVAQISEYVKTNADAITGTANVELWQRVVYQVGFTIVPMLFMVGCFIFMGATFRINEKNHEEMVAEIEKRKVNKTEEVNE
jgi:melibiose permease/lactose/raffinose/galactose permease